MTLSKMLWSMGLMAAGAVGIAHAGPPASPTYVSPYSPAPVVSGPVISSPAGPGCATPSVLPGTIVPGTPVMPSTPGVTPSTPSMTPSTPSVTPSDAGAAAGMAAAGAGGSTVGTGGGEGGSGSLTSGAPNMIGDLGIKGFYRDARLFSSNSSSFGNSSSSSGKTVSPLVGQATFRIIENESPRPQNRIFFALNYYDQAGGTLGGVNSFNLYRSTVGFERAFLDGSASFGVRVPLLYRDTGIGQTVDGFGDITLIGKYAFINDRDTGSVVGGGVAVTIPLREIPILDPGTGNVKDINSVLLQPYLGVLANMDRFYVQGFLSYVMPTNKFDTVFVSSDIGVGFKMYSNPGAGLSAVIPTLEAHMINPLNNRSISNSVNGLAPVGFCDQVVITGGVHLGLCDRTYLTLAYGTAVTGTNLFNYEATVQLNVGF